MMFSAPILYAFLVALSAASVLLLPEECRAADRVLFAVGSNTGLEHEETLTFGTKDATEFADLMVDLGDVARRDVHLLLNPTKAQFEARLKEVGGSVGPATTLIFYYSGHGNETHLHVAGRAIDREWLRTTLGESAATLRLMFVDACRGVKERGFALVQPFELTRSEYSGLVVMQSASRGEPAFESRRLEGGLFTRHLLSGLRGPADTDKDGRVSVDEAYAFAYEHTLADSGSTQKPDRELRISGSGTLALTTVVQTQSRVILPPEPATRYTVFRKGVRTIFAEAWSSPRGSTEIALPVGAFIVWRRSGNTSGIQEFATMAGGAHYLHATEFEPVRSAEMRRRGGTFAKAQWRVSAAAGLLVSSSFAGESSIGQTADVQYAWTPDVRQWAPNLGISLYRERFRVGSTWTKRDSLQLLGGVLTPTVSFYGAAVNVGLGVTASLTQQSKTTLDGTQTTTTPERLQFQRAGMLGQLVVRLAAAEGLAWAAALGVNPTLFRERRTSQGISADGAATVLRESTHLALSTSVALTTGLVLELE